MEKMQKFHLRVAVGVFRGVSPWPPTVALVVEKPAEADSSYQPFDDDMVGNDSCVSVVVTTCQS